jgi:predicted glutamine amidotransferase
MCGLAGYAGIPKRSRSLLANALAIGIDKRGGDGAGVLSFRRDGNLVLERLGECWDKAPWDVFRTAGTGYAALMHARKKTCGAGGKEEAHPFCIVRNDKPVLYGAHNGMIEGAKECAEEHKREYTVDSKELFELIADRQFERISKLKGYGVITWYDMADPEYIRLMKLTYSGDITIAKVEPCGLVYASTEDILNTALKISRLSLKDKYTPDVGTIYKFDLHGNLFKTDEKMPIDNLYKTYSNSDFTGYGGAYNGGNGYHGYAAGSGSTHGHAGVGTGSGVVHGSRSDHLSGWPSGALRHTDSHADNSTFDWKNYDANKKKADNDKDQDTWPGVVVVNNKKSLGDIICMDCGQLTWDAFEGDECDACARKFDGTDKTVDDNRVEESYLDALNSITISNK